MQILRRYGRADDIVWPRRPFACRIGACVAVHFADDGIHVAVRDKHRALAWLPLELAMSEEELQSWLRHGRRESRPGTDGRLR